MFVLGQIGLSDVVQKNYAHILVEVQALLDWCVCEENKVGLALFEQIKHEPLKSFQYIDKLKKLLPPNIDFQQFARSQPSILLLNNERNIEYGNQH